MGNQRGMFTTGDVVLIGDWRMSTVTMLRMLQDSETGLSSSEFSAVFADHSEFQNKRMQATTASSAQGNPYKQFSRGELERNRIDCRSKASDCRRNTDRTSSCSGWL